MSKREQYSDYGDYLKKRCANNHFNEGLSKKADTPVKAAIQFKKAIELNPYDKEALYELQQLKGNNSDCS